jgi:sugar lactone lactonase YvrE
MRTEYDAEVLFHPDAGELGFLPEGPYPLGEGRMLWVAIQHGETAVRGSLNVLDLESRRNRTFALPGRPGFAFPTTDPQVFLIGCEKQVGFYRPESGEWIGPALPVESHIGGTIVNDALIHGDALIFGTKDVAFQAPLGGLYFWRPTTGAFGRLAERQTCSNGKVILETAGALSLLDIDTPTRKVVAYPFDPEAGRVGEPRVALDLGGESAYPDGMIATPDGRSVVIAFYDPGEPAFGVARQYGLESGEVEVVWRTAGSPRVTCPQWLLVGGRSRLVLTTAAEHMSEEQRRLHPRAGALFLADAHWSEVTPPSPFPLPPGL